RPLAELYFIIGADAFLEIHTWKDVEGLFRTTHFVVTSRPGSTVHDLVHILEKTVTARWHALTFAVGFDERTGVATLQAAHSEKVIYLAPIVHLDISATDIRQRVGEGRSIRYLVHESVEDYIRRHALYKES
ncbi:MAG: nicotinate-nicotinamide nucleotide adenylyltransferase, partial [Nitrospinota bacterium]